MVSALKPVASCISLIISVPILFSISLCTNTNTFLNANRCSFDNSCTLVLPAFLTCSNACSFSSLAIELAYCVASVNALSNCVRISAGRSCQNFYLESLNSLHYLCLHYLCLPSRQYQDYAHLERLFFAKQ